MAQGDTNASNRKSSDKRNISGKKTAKKCKLKTGYRQHHSQKADYQPAICQRQISSGSVFELEQQKQMRFIEGCKTKNAVSHRQIVHAFTASLR